MNGEEATKLMDGPDAEILPPIIRLSPCVARLIAVRRK